MTPRDPRDEGGFGLLELVIAMLLLSVALLALVAAFSSATSAMSRSRDIGAATAVADKQMELYRSLANCAIWLDRWLIPATGSDYAADGDAYNGTASSSPQIPYWDPAGTVDDQSWATDGMDSANSFSQPNLASCAYQSQSSSINLDQQGGLTQTQGEDIDSQGLVTPPPSAVKPVQDIAGPDGATYPVDTYIVLVQPTNGEWTKQVTVVVRDPTDTSRVLAREVSIFDPAVG